MSFVNEKGGYTKVLEITRENSNRSVTMLKEDFLTKSENYVLNVTDFVTSTSPPLNEIDEPYFRIMPRGDYHETLVQAELRLPGFLDKVNVREFRPKNYRTWMELARQMTIVDFFLYRQIMPHECLSVSWTKPDKEKRAPHIISMTKRFNKVTKWIVITLVNELDPARRIKLMQYFLTL